MTKLEAKDFKKYNVESIKSYISMYKSKRNILINRTNHCKRETKKVLKEEIIELSNVIEMLEKLLIERSIVK